MPGIFFVATVNLKKKEIIPFYLLFYIYRPHINPDMKKFSLSFVALVFFISANAQQSTFRTQYNYSQFDWPTGMVQATSGNYIFSSFEIGISIPLGPKGGLTEIDQNGNHVKSTLYNNGAFSTSVNFADIKKATSGGYIVTGDANSQCLIAKIPTAFGAPTWQYRYIPVSGASAYGNKIIQATDGGFVVAGSASQVNNGSAMTDSSKMYAVKVDANGAVVWSKVFFFTTAFDDDDYLNAVTEVSDGYVFVGSITTSANDGPSDAVVIKTDFNGTLQWARRFGNSNSEDVQSVIQDAGNNIIMSGLDNLGAYIYNWSAPNSGPSVIGTNMRYYATGLPVTAGNLTKTADNNLAVFASGASLNAFTTILFKADRNTGLPLFARSYNSFISILPTGIQAADSGFLMNSLSADINGGSGGYDFGVTKTDVNGNQGTGSICPPSNITILTQSYSPTVNSFSPVIPTLTNVRNSGGIAGVTSTPGVTINCQTIVCTKPPTPSLSANPTTICSGSSSTLTASGGSNVTYKYYTQSSGGTSIGSGATLVVSPTVTTIYYVEADDNTNPGCVSNRSAGVTVTVNNAPSSVGNISGSANPCLGSANYSITATGATTYAWTVSGGGTISGANTANATINWTTSGGPYTVSVTVSNSCGSTSKTLSVTVVAGVSGVGASGSPNPACVGGTVTLTGAGSGVNNWSWTGPNGFTSNTQSPQILNVTATAAGLYTLIASSTCGSGNGSFTLVVNNVPQNVTASPGTQTICAGNTINLTGAGTNATSWSWSGPNSFTANTQNASVSNAQQNATGTYTLTATNACGNTTATANVTVNTTPTTVSASANPNPVCAGNTLNLTGGATGAVSYAWTGPNSYSSSQLNNTISNFQNINAGTYTFTATNTCGSTQSTVPVTIATVPSGVTATANLTNICSNASLTLNGNGNNASSFSWTGPNGFSSTSQNPTKPNVTLADSGLYTLTATNACGNTTASVNVDVDTVIQNLSVNATPNNSVCAGATIQLQGSGTQVNTWSWTGPNNFISSQQSPSIPNSTTAASGTYTVTTSNACGTSTATLSVLVNNAIASLSATATTGAIICNGTTISLTATGTNVNGYNWTGPNGFTSTQQNLSINNATVAATGTYTVTANNACGNQTATVSVQVDTLIENLTSSASPNDTVCAGGAINLNANGTNVNTWSWVGPNNFTSAQQNASVPNATAAASGTYTVTATNGCGNAQASVAVLVNDPIQNVTATASSNGLVCSGSSITLTTTGTNANSFSWTGVNGFSSTQQNPVINPATTASSGTYTVTVNNACGSQSASVTVQVDTLITGLAVSASPNDTLCAGGTISLSGTGINVTSWSWSGPNGFTSSQQTTSVNNAQSINSGTYTLTATNACGTSTSSLTVLVKTAPALSLTITGPVIPCGNTNGTYTVAASSDVTSYNWTITGGNITGGQGTNSVTVSWGTVAGTYSISVTASNECGNGSTANLTVVVDVPTVLGIAATNDTICYNTSTVLTASVAPVSTIVSWYLDPVGGTEIGTGATYITGDLTQTTTFYAQATSSNGCSNLQGRVPATVTVTPLPVVTLTSDKDGNNNFPTAFPNEVVNFTAIPDSFDNYEFFWNGTSVQTGTSNTWSSSKINNLDSVWVIATANGCVGLRSEDTVRIVDFPNAFTPNSDGVNDVFLNGYQLIITNRWGQTLYDGRDGWDGRYKGDKVSPGTYYYIVTLDNITDRKSAIKGTVLLIED